MDLTKCFWKRARPPLALKEIQRPQKGNQAQVTATHQTLPLKDLHQKTEIEIHQKKAHETRHLKLAQNKSSSNFCFVSNYNYTIRKIPEFESIVRTVEESIQPLNDSLQLKKLIVDHEQCHVWKASSEYYSDKILIAKKRLGRQIGLQEVAWLKYLQGKYVVPLVDYYYQSDNIWILMERGNEIKVPCNVKNVVEAMLKVVDVMSRNFDLTDLLSVCYI